MPFNSPLAGVAWKVFPALLCGNAVVVKSHELTPYTAIAFGKLLKDAGLPAACYGAVQGYGPEPGAPLVQDHRVGVVSFTGSSATGKLIQKMVSERACSRRCASSLAARIHSSSVTMPISISPPISRSRRRSSMQDSGAHLAAASSCSMRSTTRSATHSSRASPR
jgi:hypothetical protein